MNIVVPGKKTVVFVTQTAPFKGNAVFAEKFTAIEETITAIEETRPVVFALETIAVDQETMVSRRNTGRGAAVVEIAFGVSPALRSS
jgi:hypothetical protein